MVGGRLPEQVTSVTQHNSGGCRTHASPSMAPGTISASLGSCPHALPQTHTHLKCSNYNVSTGHVCVYERYLPLCKTSNLWDMDRALLWHLLASECTVVSRMWTSGVELPCSWRRVHLSIIMFNRIFYMSIALKITSYFLCLNIYDNLGIGFLPYIAYSFSVSPWRNRGSPPSLLLHSDKGDSSSDVSYLPISCGVDSLLFVLCFLLVFPFSSFSLGLQCGVQHVNIVRPS